MPKLTAKRVETLKEPGFYGDGEGLYLLVRGSKAKSWVLRTVVHGKRRDLGLGSASLVSLAEARTSARALRKIAREGGDPDAFRKRESLTFEEAAVRVHNGLLPTFRNPKHGQLWISSLRMHVFPRIGTRPIHTLGTADVLSVLSPIWTETHDTARRIRQRISTIFDWAKGAGHFPHENPVNGLKKALPPVKRSAEHMASMPWTNLPEFMKDLARRDGVSARTLEFLILTGLRSGEVRGAKWSEIHGSTWNVPGERMKGGRPHKVPLSLEAMVVLDKVRGLDVELVFPSVKRGKGGEAVEQSVNVFIALLDRMQRNGFTVHGFRSCFRDWCSESAKADREIAEAALAHTVGNAVERSYARSDLFERRRVLMEAWGRFASGKTGKVVDMVRA